MNKKMLKVVLAITIACFFHVATYAAGKDLLKSNIPQIYGKSKGQSEGSSDLTIIHVQDAHGNVEARENIQSIIKTLVEQGKVDALFDEGQWWEEDASAFDKVSDEGAELVADFWTKYALFTGADRYQALNDRNMPLLGADDKDLNDAGLKNLKNSHANKKESLAMAKKMKGAMEALKLKIYNEETRGFLQALEDFDADKITLTSYAKTLQAEADKAGVKWSTFNNFNKVVESIQLEDKIDFAKIDRERLDLIDELETKVDKKVSDEIVTKSLNYRLGRLSAADYYNFLLEKSLAAKIDMSKYENVQQYAKLVNIYADINDDALFAETDRLEAAVKGKIFKTDAQVNFDKHFQNLEVLTKMIGLEMTRADLAYYNDNKPSAVKAVAFLQKSAKDLGLGIEVSDTLGKIDQNLASNVKFYEIAMKRDEIMVENTLAMMDERGFKTVVLVAGGFHTEGIIKALKAKTVSHMIITPRITNPDAPNYHLQKMLGEETEASKILKEIRVNTQDTKTPGLKDTVAPTLDYLEKKAAKEAGTEAVGFNVEELVNATAGLPLSAATNVDNALKTIMENSVKGIKGNSVENVQVKSLPSNLPAFVNKDGSIQRPAISELSDDGKTLTIYITSGLADILANSNADAQSIAAVESLQSIEQNKGLTGNKLEEAIFEVLQNQSYRHNAAMNVYGRLAQLGKQIATARGFSPDSQELADIFNTSDLAKKALANIENDAFVSSVVGNMADAGINSKDTIKLIDDNGKVTEEAKMVDKIASAAIAKVLDDVLANVEGYQAKMPYTSKDLNNKFVVLEGNDIAEAMMVGDIDLVKKVLQILSSAIETTGRGTLIAMENQEDYKNSSAFEKDKYTLGEDVKDLTDLNTRLTNKEAVLLSKDQMKRLGLFKAENKDNVMFVGSKDFIQKDMKSKQGINIEQANDNVPVAKIGMAYAKLAGKAVEFYTANEGILFEKGHDVKQLDNPIFDLPVATPVMQAFLQAMHAAVVFAVAA